MTNRDGIYFRLGLEAAGVIRIKGTDVTATTLWGTRRQLFNDFRENYLGITLSEMATFDLVNENDQ